MKALQMYLSTVEVKLGSALHFGHLRSDEHIPVSPVEGCRWNFSRTESMICSILHDVTMWSMCVWSYLHHLYNQNQSKYNMLLHHRSWCPPLAFEKNLSGSLYFGLGRLLVIVQWNLFCWFQRIEKNHQNLQDVCRVLLKQSQKNHLEETN